MPLDADLTGNHFNFTGESINLDSTVGSNPCNDAISMLALLWVPSREW